MKKFYINGRQKDKIIVGVDEAGRGALAGPVVAAAVLISGLDYKRLETGVGFIPRESGVYINDSKKMSGRQRETAFNYLGGNKQVKWAPGVISEKVIDRINILQATKLAMQKAVRSLERKAKKKIDLLLIDGNTNLNAEIRQQLVIKGDERIFLIKVASIMAKVYRDRMMENYAKKFPEYKFELHKGYGTKLHFDKLKEYGPCKIHRKTFAPLKNFLERY